MSSQTISRAVVQGPAEGALALAAGGTAPWVYFTAVGLDALGSLLTVGSLLLFTIIVVVTGALVATSICLRRAAQRLPPTSLSPEAVAQSKLKTRRVYLVSGVAIAAILLAVILLDTLYYGELVSPIIGLILGIDFLLIALLGQARLFYLTGGALTLLAVVAVLALLFGVTLGGVYIWTVVVGLGNIMIFWLTVLYLLYVGGRLLHQGLQ